MSGRRKKVLEDQDWFHGLLPRKEITELLRHHGDWLVRCTEKSGETRIVISVRWKDQFRHIMLKRDRDGYRMPHRTFDDAVDLVEYYSDNGKELNDLGIKLNGKPIKRRKWMIPSKDVGLERKIGEGAFGEVYVGKLRHKEKQIPVAVKTCKQAMTNEERDEFLKEAKLMLNYRHINVVRLYGVAADKPPIMLVMENCPSGSLDSHLRKKGANLKDKIRYCIEAARGMEYLAVRKECVHRDLAARNCLIGFNREVKIADFGLSRKGEYQLVDMKNSRLPIKWAAPESLEQGQFSFASDIWSFGILMWEIFADGETPWPGKTNRDAYIAMKNGEKMDMPTSEPPAEIRYLMYDCWALDPKERPNITQVKNRLEATGDRNGVNLPPAPTIRSSRRSSQ